MQNFVIFVIFLHANLDPDLFWSLFPFVPLASSVRHAPNWHLAKWHPSWKVTSSSQLYLISSSLALLLWIQQPHSPLASAGVDRGPLLRSHPPLVFSFFFLTGYLSISGSVYLKRLSVEELSLLNFPNQFAHLAGSLFRCFQTSLSFRFARTVSVSFSALVFPPVCPVGHINWLICPNPLNNLAAFNPASSSESWKSRLKGWGFCRFTATFN